MYSWGGGGGEVTTSRDDIDGGVRLREYYLENAILAHFRIEACVKNNKYVVVTATLSN